MMTERMSPKDTAVLIRRALKDRFPGVKFSLTCAPGSSYGYMYLSWTDGPRTGQVDEVVEPFRSERLSDQPDDSVVRLDVPYTCKGVICSRQFSGEVLDWADTQVTQPDEYRTRAHRLLAMHDLTQGVPG